MQQHRAATPAHAPTLSPVSAEVRGKVGEGASLGIALLLRMNMFGHVNALRLSQDGGKDHFYLPGFTKMQCGSVLSLAHISGLMIRPLYYVPGRPDFSRSRT